MAAVVHDLSGGRACAPAFRPIDEASLSRNPFRMFTSLFCTGLVKTRHYAGEAGGNLMRRDIFASLAGNPICWMSTTSGAVLVLLGAEEFVRETLEL